MDTALWICQALLAIIFLLIGIAKATFSRERLIATKQTGVVGLPMHIVRFIGLSEILGSFGLILPWLLNIYPVLTPISALGLGVIMILAAISHYELREPKNVRNNIILLLLCLFVAAGRAAELM